MEANIELIRQTADWLRSQSVSSNADSSAPITKAELENFREKIALAILDIANALDE